MIKGTQRPEQKMTTYMHAQVLEREGERESEGRKLCVCVCVCVRARVGLCEERGCVVKKIGCFMSVCVCEREREREREREERECLP